jgi:glycosyltransferase involved in cell wall biosynthesis
VVATNTGAAQTLITPESGVVCMPGDLDQLAKALRRLIFDRTLRADMAEAAWQVGRALPSWADQAVKLASVLVSRFESSSQCGSPHYELSNR